MFFDRNLAKKRFKGRTQEAIKSVVKLYIILMVYLAFGSTCRSKQFEGREVSRLEQLIMNNQKSLWFLGHAFYEFVYGFAQVPCLAARSKLFLVFSLLTLRELSKHILLAENQRFATSNKKSILNFCYFVSSNLAGKYLSTMYVKPYLLKASCSAFFLIFRKVLISFCHSGSSLYRGSFCNS